MDNVFNYRAKVTRIIDGDTVELLVSLGFHLFFKIHVRLARINTPGIRSSDPELKLKAYDAKKFLENSFELNNNQVYINVLTKGKYGRWVCEVFIGESFDVNISDLIVKNDLGIYHQY